jgi:hypothetical protein
MLPASRACRHGCQKLKVDLNKCSLVKFVTNIYGYHNATSFVCTNLEVIALDLLCGDEFTVTLSDVNISLIKIVYMGGEQFSRNEFMMFFNPKA